MRHRLYQPARIFHVVAGIVFQIDWIIDQAYLHARIISKAIKQKQLWRGFPEQVLLFITENIYADESAYFFKPTGSVV
jgi:hypothetical protein